MPPEETVTTDPAGINRTGTGEITTDPATTTQPDSSKTTTTQDSKSLLNQGTDADKKTDPAADSKTEPKKDSAKDSAKTGAPEQYEAWKVPDQYVIDPDTGKEINSLFKDLGLSQEAGQKLVDFYINKTQQAFEEPFTAYETMRKEWRDASESHTDLRGKLGVGGEVLTTIGKALDDLGNKDLVSEFKQLMDLTGAGDHPAFIRVLYGLAKQLTEGTHVGGGGPAKEGQTAPGSKTSQPSAAGALWPNLPSANRG